jgi:hypothetical protein
MAVLEERWYTLSKRMTPVHEQLSRQLDKARFASCLRIPVKLRASRAACSLLAPLETIQLA